LGGDEWVDADHQRTALFTYLPPGDYRFEVAAAGADGLWLPTTASLALTVRAAWWETSWFHSSVGLLGALALAASVKFAVKRRMRARMRRLQQQHALEKERARIARDMHDDVGASLTQIAIASQLARLDPPEEALGHIDEIAGIARRTVTALDEIVWAVNPRNDTLPALLEYLGQHAVDFLTAAGVECEIEMPPELPSHPLAAHVRHHLFLAVKESLNNIVKHAAASAVKLNVELGENRLCVTITDNGCGFVAGHERAGSDGLRNMRERMAELGGECRIESRPEEGTRVVFELPLPSKGV
jgi:signal transduction histidine kinase